MREHILYINCVYVDQDRASYTCYGLGSCVGLFVSDRVTGLSGGAHIPLPSALPGEFLGACELIEKLMKTLTDRGSNLANIRAKIVGGSQVYPSAIRMGEANVNAVIEHLMHRKVFLAAMDVGGTVSRTARFNSSTGEILITTSEQRRYLI